MPVLQSSTLKASDVMTANPRTCSTFSTVLEAVMIFRDAECGAVPVLEDGKPIGILCDRDVALAVAEHGDLPMLPVTQIVTKGCVTVSPDEPLEGLIEKIGNRRDRRLLVVDADARLLGIVAWTDVAPYTNDVRVEPTPAAAAEPMFPPDVK